VLTTGATATDQADITIVQVTPQITANNKTYDGSDTATLSAQSVSGAVSGETVTLIVGAASFDNADKGVGKTVTASTLTLGGTNASNYALSSATATALANIASIALTPHITAAGKAYDGNTTATLSAQSVTGMTPGKTDVILLVNAANFDTRNIGENKTVTATGLTLGGSDASNYVLASSSVTSQATVTAIEVTPHITAGDKPYDGLSTAPLSEKYVTGQLVSEEVTLVATATFDNKDIGTGKTVTTSTLALGGADAGNYVLTSAAPLTAQATITVLQVTPHITANDKAYDGNTTVTLSEQSVVGKVSGEAVTLTVGEVSFDTKNVGTGKTVTASSLSLAGADAGNYLLTSGITVTDQADITALQLTPHITADDKAYDGNATAAISAQSVTGQLSGEPVTLVVGASNFDTKNIRTGKTVTASSLSLGGAYVANYVLASSTATDLADITAIQVTPQIVADNKPYDGNTTAILSSKTLTGQILGDGGCHQLVRTNLFGVKSG
jgi:hypothetical protein